MHSSKTTKLRGKYSFLQKRKSNIPKGEHEANICTDRPESKNKDAKNNLSSLSCLLIIFKISDNRRRDIDGMVATVFDSLVHGGVLSDDSIREVPTAITTFIKCKKGEEGFDAILIEK